MKSALTILICLIVQFAFAQAVDNYSRNKKMSDDEDARFEGELKTNKDKAEVYWKHANVVAAFPFRASATAGEYYEKALSIDRSKPVYFFDYANYLHKIMKDDAKARQIYRKALKLFPENPELLKGLNDLNKPQADSDSPSMRETLRESGMIYTPQSPITQSIYAAGEVLFKNGEYEKSIRAYLKALELEPEFIDAMDNLGNSYRYMNRLDSAEYWYNKSVSLYPEGFVAHQNLAIIYMSTERSDKALFEYEILTRLDARSPEGYFGKANVNILLGNGSEVVTNAQKARELYRDNGDEYERDAVYLIGVGYYLQNDTESARKYLLEAREMGVLIPSQLEGVLR